MLTFVGHKQYCIDIFPVEEIHNKLLSKLCTYKGKSSPLAENDTGCCPRASAYSKIMPTEYHMGNSCSDQIIVRRSPFSAFTNQNSH